MEQLGQLSNGRSGSPELILCGLVSMCQAALIDGVLFDLPPSVDDGLIPTAVDFGGSEVAEAFVVAAVTVALDEGADAGFEIAS